MSENPDFLQYLWVLISAPIGFVAQKYVSISNRVTKLETQKAFVLDEVRDINTKIDAMCEKLDTLTGRIEEHLRK